MSFDLLHIWQSMGPLARIIAAVLGVMAIASIGVVVERSWALGRSARASRRFVKEIAPHLKAWDLEQVRQVALQHEGSALARIFAAITRKYLGAKAEGGSESPVKLARGEAERSREAIGADMRRGMNILASVGSVAPFVGLLGTVVGIIAAFQGIADKGSGGLGAVSAGIAEALIETAFGLTVAIPAVLFFNYLSGRIVRIEGAIARSAGELLDDMENHDGREPQHKVARKAA
jgi:biopolymer transport protein ExbB/TolQ